MLTSPKLLKFNTYVNKVQNGLCVRKGLCNFRIFVGNLLKITPTFLIVDFLFKFVLNFKLHYLSKEILNPVYMNLI